MTHQRTLNLLLIILFLLSFCLGCEQINKFSATKIGDVLDNPRNYENKEVIIYGTVSESASLVFVKFFTVRDDTGSIRVLTQRALPKQGEVLGVTGYVEPIEVGTERWIVLREKTNKDERKHTRDTY